MLSIDRHSVKRPLNTVINNKSAPFPHVIILKHRVDSHEIAMKKRISIYCFTCDTFLHFFVGALVNLLPVFFKGNYVYLITTMFLHLLLYLSARSSQNIYHCL